MALKLQTVLVRLQCRSFLYHVLGEDLLTSFSGEGYKIPVAALLEIYFGLLCACAPALKPIFGKLAEGISTRWKSSRSSQQQSDKLGSGKETDKAGEYKEMDYSGRQDSNIELGHGGSRTHVSVDDRYGGSRG